MQKTEYNYANADDVCATVMLSRPSGVGPATVYVPPHLGDLPYTVTFNSIAEAEAYALSEARRVGVSRAATTDGYDWWLANLTPVT